MMEISIYSTYIWVTAILIISLDIVILIGSKNSSSRAFVILSFLASLWVISQGFFISTTNQTLADFLIRLQYTLGITIAIIFYNFSIIYPYDHRVPRIVVVNSAVGVFLFVILYLLTDTMISGVYQIGGIERWAWNFGGIHLLFDFSFYLLWAISLQRIYTNYRREIGELKINLGNMFIALFLGVIPATLGNIFLPSIGEFRMNWIGPITSFIWVFILAYSIIKYRQMNVKIIATEVLAIGMAILFFINIFTNIYTNIILRLVIFLIFILLAIFLIRASLSEERQKEQLHDLNTNLNKKVIEQTTQIKVAYELERRARRDWEKLSEAKDQFIMITQHNIRTPVNTITRELNRVKDVYTFKMPPLEKSFLQVFSSLHTLTRMVNDFLSITTLKKSSQILSVSEVNIQQLLENSLNELRVDIEIKKISVTYPQNILEWPEIKVDKNKMQEVITIIIENAIKYNIVGGKITVTTESIINLFKISIHNTGIGMTHEEKSNIFERLFFRTKKAQDNNPQGMGIGLSVSQAIIKAHHGDLSINSKGVGEGATVIITLPFDFLRDLQEELSSI